MANYTFEQWTEKTETTLDQFARAIKIKLFHRGYHGYPC